MELQLGGEALGDRRRAELGSVEAQARGGQTAPSPFWSRAGWSVAAHTLCWLGVGVMGWGDHGFSRLPPRGAVCLLPFLRSISLKTSPRAKHLAAGSDFPHPPRAPSAFYKPARALQARPLSLPPLPPVHEPVAVTSATLWRPTARSFVLPGLLLP